LPAQIHPLDLAPILPRVSLAQRVLLVEEGPLSGGWGAETAARLQVACWQTLKAPILRVAAKDLPVPSAPSLEKQVLPQVQDIVQALYKLKTGY
jgi:pyruvate/2-oxoglutarate/acetoin dehydrogenase E1 component